MPWYLFRPQAEFLTREFRRAPRAQADRSDLHNLAKEGAACCAPTTKQQSLRYAGLRCAQSKPHSKNESTDLKVGRHKDYRAKAQSKQRTNVRQAADLRFDRRHCQRTWPRSNMLRIRPARKNLRVFRL